MDDRAKWNSSRRSDRDVEVNSTAGPDDGISCANTWFFLAIYGPLYGLVCVLGLVGNCLSICVLRAGRSRRQAVSTYLLKALAVCDNVFLATAAVVQMYPAIATVGGHFEHLQRIYPYYQIVAWPLAHIVQLVSVWMMVLVAGNRYVAVCHPLHAASLCSRRHVRWQIIAMVTASVVYSLPRFAEFRSDHPPYTFFFCAFVYLFGLKNKFNGNCHLRVAL